MIAAVRARVAAMPTNLVLAGFVAAGMVLAASLALSIPEGLAAATDDVRESFRNALRTPAALTAAFMAALYAGFDYTLALKRGVVAREAASGRRVAVLFSRAVLSVIGGLVVGLACGAGTVIAGGIAGAGWMPTAPLLATVSAAGALAAVWGFSVSVVVRHHLVALFVVPASLGVAVPLATLLPEPASVLPLPALIGTAGVDAATLGFASSVGHVPLVVWLATALTAASARFLQRDVT